MIETDVDDKCYDLQQIIENMSEKKEINMFKIFLQCDYLIFKEIMLENKKFKGKIKTNQSVYDAYFVIKENKQYWDKVSSLYQMQQFSFYY